MSVGVTDGLPADVVSALDRYLPAVVETAGDRLVAVWLFGSFARGDAWWAGSPMHSDIDLLVVTTTGLAETTQQALVDSTYGVFLESGRQVSPQFWSRTKWDAPPDDKARSLKAQVADDGRLLWSPA